MTLSDLCIEYSNLIDAIENAHSSGKILVALEERRCELHNLVLNALDSNGIEYSDRWHATEIALYIARGL